MGVATELTLARHVVSRWRRRLDVAQIALWGVTWLVLAFLIAPIAIIVLTSLTSTPTVEFPPQGFSLVWYQRFIATLQGAPGTRPALARSIWFSTYLGLLVSGLATFGGVLAALTLHKFVFRGKEVFQNLFLLPLTFPSLVLGVGLLLTFSEFRLFDRFTRLLIGHVVTALPYVVLSVSASLKVYEEDVEEAARSLGANPLRTLWHITLPLIRPGILAGAVFAFLTSFTNFTVSFFLSSGSVKPMPIWIYEFIMNGHSPLLAAISVFLVAMTVGVVIVLERLVGLRQIVGTST
ncbi:MAG: ABC transporter permease [Candidatus Rokuibacteriota bacterium]|nr:MAG: ABC transporter permease [Candidatus Rokubacteria bacterium]